MKATEHNKTGEKMHVYEVSFLITPAVSEEKIGDEFAAIKTLVEKAGGEMIAEQFPELMKLAYTMEQTVDAKKNKFTEGYFGWVKFELPVAALADIKNALEKKVTIFRHLIIKTVRENTMFTAKAPAAKEGSEAAPETAVSAEGEKTGEVVAKDIDKTIDALVIN